MTRTSWKDNIQSYDDRRDFAILDDKEATITYSIEHFLQIAEKAIEDRGMFTVALSGGSTPKAIYEGLAKPKYRNRIDWSRVLLFWSDERCVSPDHPDSNYRMAMKAGLEILGISTNHLFRMKGEGDEEKNARDYDQLIKENVPEQRFDLVMLGMGEDGHTASLFPKTHGLHTVERYAIANFLPEKDVWRLTLTYQCINAARHIAIYVIGKNKLPTLKQVFISPYDPDHLPIQRIGTPENKALWITDQDFSI